MNISRFLSKVFGIYLVLISAAFLLNMNELKTILQDLLHNHSLMLVSGFFTLIIGLLLIVSHNIWQFNWKLIITILSWIIFLKGVSIIFFPQFIDKLTLYFVQNSYFAYGSIILDLIIGFVLLYFGFRKNKNY